jgi:hypothetical protein
MIWLTLFLGGFLGHRMMYWILGIGNKGEVTTETEIDKSKGTLLPRPVTTQEQFDSMIQERINRERAKYADYDELKKFQAEQLQKQDKHAQEELEKAKKYEEAKKNYETQIDQHKEILTKKDIEIQDLRISHALINEINKQNGYAEETLALIKPTAVLDANGSVTIKGKDANGIDVQLPATEGIKRFLETRPYLIKSTHKAGAGSAGGTSTSGSAETINLNELNAQYADALNRRDYKKVNELTAKIKSQLQAKGVTNI